MAKPIFCATHPRACSTAFERVFMTRKDLACVHEPFGDAFYYGPERLSSRFENDETTRDATGFSSSTYRTIFDRLGREGAEGNRVFIKDIIYYLVPPNGKASQIAPSLLSRKRGIGTQAPATNGIDGVNGNVPNGDSPFPYKTEIEPGNPTVVPHELLEQFHFTFLIRDPHSSIPSYYRCTVPPLEDLTGFHDFMPNEAGYDELRRFFDYSRQSGLVGHKAASKLNGATNGEVNGDHVNGTSEAAATCVIDADDLLDDPEGIIKAYCRTVGLDYDPSMLNWDNEEDQARAEDAFEKWKGFHEDALESKDLKPRKHKKAKKTEAQWDAQWKEAYGDEAARMIRKTVDENMEDYLYLKRFAVQV